MSALLDWQHGPPCNGKFYYSEASIGDVRFTLSRVTVCDVEQYELHVARRHLSKADALAFAEQLAQRIKKGRR